MTTKPKPSDEILNSINEARRPDHVHLTLDGGWELGDVQRVLIRLLEWEDERWAAERGEPKDDAELAWEEQNLVGMPDMEADNAIANARWGFRAGYGSLKSKLAGVEAELKEARVEYQRRETNWYAAGKESVERPERAESALAEANARAERLWGLVAKLIEQKQCTQCLAKLRPLKRALLAIENHLVANEVSSARRLIKELIINSSKTSEKT